MAQLIIQYTPDNNYEDNVIIKYNIKDEPNISVIHRLMKQACAAMGYTEKTIDEWFGETGFID